MTKAMTSEEFSALISGSLLEGPYIVETYSAKLGIRRRVRFSAASDALEFAKTIADKARIFHQERSTSGKTCDSYSGLKRAFAQADFYDCASDAYKSWWVVSVIEVHRNGEAVWLKGYRYGANRMADPESRIFIRTRGKDAEGFEFCRVDEYRYLSEAKEATDQLEDTLAAAGVTFLVHETITKDEYETSSL